MQVVSLTQLVPLLIAGKTIVAALLYSANTPITNLLRRDSLFPLNINIICTQDGLYEDFPEEQPAGRIPATTQQEITDQVQPLMYWLQLTPQESKLPQECQTLELEWEKQMDQYCPCTALSCMKNIVTANTMKHARRN